jgi:hypothetical protein
MTWSKSSQPPLILAAEVVSPDCLDTGGLRLHCRVAFSENYDSDGFAQSRAAAEWFRGRFGQRDEGPHRD